MVFNYNCEKWWREIEKCRLEIWLSVNENSNLQTFYSTELCNRGDTLLLYGLIQAWGLRPHLEPDWLTAPLDEFINEGFFFIIWLILIKSSKLWLITWSYVENTIFSWNAVHSLIALWFYYQNFNKNLRISH